MNAALRPLSAWSVTVYVCLCVSLACGLAGCGGGGNSTTDEGFRFVPDGQGAVIPYPNVHFEYTAGSVASGVVVSAAPAAAAALPAAPSGATQLGSAYQITFSLPSVTFTPPARIYLPYDPAKLPTNSVPRIYIAVPVTGGAAAWQVLPVSTAAPAGPANTLEAQLPATVPSGSLLTIFAGTPGGLPGLNPFFGTYTLSYTGTTSGSFGVSVAADGTAAGVTGGPAVTGTVSTAGAVSLVSAGQTYTGTLAVDSTSGAVTASATAWSGAAGAAGTWSLQ